MHISAQAMTKDVNENFVEYEQRWEDSFWGKEGGLQPGQVGMLQLKDRRVGRRSSHPSLDSSGKFVSRVELELRS